MKQRTKQTITITFDIVVNMDEDSTQQDVINENEYVLAEAKNYLNSLEGFRAGSGVIENASMS